MASTTDVPFRPALVIVDMQEDFCPDPPDRKRGVDRNNRKIGSLAVEGGRDIAKQINELLKWPWTLKIATRDAHPAGHISFDTHPKNHGKEAFKDTVKIQNPLNPEETDTSKVWPVHCVDGSPGAELIPEIRALHEEDGDVHIVMKGYDERVEMYSAFEDPFKILQSKPNISELLKEKAITDVYVVGLALDYCVRCTAVHSAERNFKTYVIREATKAVNPAEVEAVFEEMKDRGVIGLSVEDPVVQRVRKLEERAES